MGAENENLVAGLEQLLDMARKGDIRGMVFAANRTAGGDPHYGYIGDVTICPVLGALELLKVELVSDTPDAFPAKGLAS